MADRITLRDYRSFDLDAIFRLDEICFSTAFHFDRESMREFAERSQGVCLIAEAEEAIVGFVIAHLERSAKSWRGYVVTLDVAMEFRHRGIAESLMLEAEDRLKMLRARWMDLHVFTGNEGAIRFYERFGYKQVGVLRGFYGQPGLDAFSYRKYLNHVTV